MSSQREIGRWPFARRRVRDEVPGTIELLDTISLTALFTDPTLSSAPPPGTDADRLFATVSRNGGADTPDTGGRPVEPEDDLPVWDRLPLRKIAVGLGGLALVSGSVAAGFTMAATSATPPSPAPHVSDAPVASRLEFHPTSFNLPAAKTAPAPPPPQVANASPTAPHEVFGYAPYWSLPEASQFPLGDFSTIAYFSLDVNPNGSIQESGPGWNGYESQDFADLVDAAHQAGDRVVLTATDFSQSSLDTLTSDPTAGETLGVELYQLVKDKNLDGVNLDLEGTGSADQAGLDHLVSQVDFVLHGNNPHYQLTMATYASSAGDPNGFYDISGLSKWVDAFFVMAYDVSQGPTGDGDENGSDASYVTQYASAVGASKVILGLPLFGYDEPTSGPDLGDAPAGPSEPVTYAQAVASGPTYWDAATQTAWTSYQVGGQWHQVFFDNANTLDLKVKLAVQSNLLGVGAWALGMEGDDNSVLSVLDGGSAPLRTPPVGPTATVTKDVSTKHGSDAAESSSASTSTAPPRKHKGKAGTAGSDGAAGAAGVITTTTATSAAPKRTTTTTTTTASAPISSTSSTTSTSTTTTTTTTTTTPQGGTTIPTGTTTTTASAP
jgi:hypothetical protein